MKMGNHGQLLKTKATSGGSDLKTAYAAYQEYCDRRTGLVVNDAASIRELVDAHNEYRSKVVYLFDSRPNSGQEGFRSSMLEELFVDLFSDLVATKLDGIPATRVQIGKANSYVSLSFTPESFGGLFRKPRPTLHTKDQDFVLGCVANMSISTIDEDSDVQEAQSIVIPVLAIECKTYLERNMLDSCAGTARRLKSGMPYCLYIVASEYMKMDVAYPELSDIDEVFILCKTSNSDRLAQRAAGKPPHPLDPDLVIELFNYVAAHFDSVWWDPTNALERGRVIGRPRR